MKETLEKILEEYLKVFPEEKERQNEYKKYLNQQKEMKLQIGIILMDIQ